jgi:hypothetical protein
MPRRSRVARRAGLVAAAVLASATLTSCDKPIPNVTFLTGSTTTLVHALNYCFDAITHCHNTSKITIINAKSNSTVLVDVPREVADQHWIVTAFSLSKGKTTPLDGYGSSVLHNRHSIRLPVPYASGGGSYYFLSVAEIRGAAQSGTWTVQVHVTE